MLRLVTIPISHYCEKARWALDRAGLAYREERHVQGVHQFAARRAGGGKTVPVLVTPDRVLAESREIVAWVDAYLPPGERLLPSDPAERTTVNELCRRFDDRLGPAGRRLMYVHMMEHRELLLAFNDQGVPAWEDRLLRHGWPVMSKGVCRELDIRPGVETVDEAVVWQELDAAAALLDDGRPYLCGDGFTAADLTFAALAAAVVMPPVYGVPLPQPSVLPPEIAAFVERARAHPAGRFALECFATHRQAPPQR